MSFQKTFPFSRPPQTKPTHNFEDRDEELSFTPNSFDFSASQIVQSQMKRQQENLSSRPPTFQGSQRPRSQSQIKYAAVIPNAPSNNFRDSLFSQGSFEFSASQIVNSQHQNNRRKFQPPSSTIASTAAKKVTSHEQSRTQHPRGFVASSTPKNRSQSNYGSFSHSDDVMYSPASLNVPGSNMKLRSIEEIPSEFREVFTFPYFNVLQSMVIDEVLYSDKSIVASAPTGSGKTVIFELAIIRLLLKTDGAHQQDKMVYVSPMKSLCAERFQDWTAKFPGLKCMELTGDTELDDLYELMDKNLICTTPEKWDSMSRRWKDNKTLFQQIKLFLVDEVHTLNDPNRGATLEAVVSRMKTLQTACQDGSSNHIRFIAVSATMPNYNDIADWLNTPSRPAVSFNLDERYRPVKLDRVIIGYPFKENSSDFRFDMNLSFRLRAIIDQHSHGKPTLIFCSSRKGVEQTAEILAKDTRTRSSGILQSSAASIHEHKLSECLRAGVGMHHAGLDSQDRHAVEELFKSSKLPILVSTSTLAMGVNLPAHLVIIKSTFFYNMGVVQEYSDMQILQMIGRAGRPQFDTSATAVIMTKMSTKSKYTSLVNGTQLIESSLHKNLIEHLNAEVVLQTINSASLALEWIRHTFLYCRVMKNPKHYGLPATLNKKEIEKRLQDLCLRDLNLLTDLRLLHLNTESSVITSSETGKLMARYCIAFETMKNFDSMHENQEGIADMLEVVSGCAEFCEIMLRHNEKRLLNSLNIDKNKETIRFPLSGKIKTKQMKINVLIQAQLSCLTVTEYALSQDMMKIFRVGQRVTKCFMELMYYGENYSLLLNSILIYKAFKTKLWFDSRYVSRQLDGIGQTMSLALANAGISTFQKLEQANPRDIEVIVNRHPPFGNSVKKAVEMLPKYELAVEQMLPHKQKKAVIKVCVDLINKDILHEHPSINSKHQSILLVGDEDNNIIYKCRIIDKALLRDGSITRTVEVTRISQSVKLNICLLSLDWVGLDIQTSFEPVYAAGWFGPVDTRPPNPSPASKLSTLVRTSKLPAEENAGDAGTGGCHHKCIDKSTCGHKCCKMAVFKPKRKQSQNSDDKKSKQAKVESYFQQQTKEVREAHAMMKKISGQGPNRITLQKFAYKPSEKLTLSSNQSSSRATTKDDMDDVNDEVIICSNTEDDSQVSDVICMDDIVKSNESVHRYSTNSTMWDSKVNEAGKKECVGSGSCDTNDACQDDVVWDLDDSFELLHDSHPIENSAKGQTENSDRIKKSNSFVDYGNKIDENKRQRSGWNALDRFVESRQALFETGQHPHLQNESDSDELPDLDESPRTSIRNICPIKAVRQPSMSKSDEELIGLADTTFVPNMDFGQIEYSNSKVQHQNATADRRNCSSINQNDRNPKELGRNIPTMLDSQSPYKYMARDSEKDRFQMKTVSSTCSKMNYSDDSQSQNFIAESSNGSQRALSIDNESINWSPKTNTNSSPSTDDALSQSSHRYGKVLAWKKGAKSSKNTSSTGPQSLPCTIPKAYVVSSGEVAQSPSKGHTLGKASSRHTYENCDYDFTKTDTNLYQSSSNVRSQTHILTLKSPILFKPVESHQESCATREENLDSQPTSTFTSRNFLSQLFAAGAPRNNSQVTRSSFDDLF